MQSGQGFIPNSFNYYEIAKKAYEKTKQGFPIHSKEDALVAIVFSALSLEAFINELGVFAEDAKAHGYTEPFLDSLINVLDESLIAPKDKTTQAKFLNASDALSNKFDKCKKPYQDFVDLFALRDCLVHSKPDRFNIDTHDQWFYSRNKVINRLRGKNIFLNTSNKSLHLLVSTEKAAKWACDIAAEMVNAILDKIPDSRFKTDNIDDYKPLGCYRIMFKALQPTFRSKFEVKTIKILKCIFSNSFTKVGK